MDGQVGEWIAGLDLAINHCSCRHIYLLSPAKMTGGVGGHCRGEGNLKDISWHRDLDSLLVCMMPLPSMCGRRFTGTSSQRSRSREQNSPKD